MRKKRFVWYFFPLFCLAISGCSRKGDVQPADLVIENAKVVTIDKDNPRAEAIAFMGEKIVAVTTNKKIKSYIDEGTTTVIDAKGRLAVPGFNDAHAHFGGIDPDYIDFRYITDPKIITEKVAEKVNQAKPGQLIRGGRWEHEMFLDKQWPTKELIDPVSPDNPVALSRADGHSVLVNSYVLKNSGITKDTPNPSGGEIQKDPVMGEPTGIFKELARKLLNYGAVEIERTPEEEEAQRLREWQAALDMAARLGVTTVHLPPGSFDMFQKLREMGKLTLRAYVGQRLDAGAKIAFGTDYAVEPLDPLEGLYAAVTRKDRAGEPGEGWFPDQKLTMEEAIEFYTLGSAYSEFMEDRKGKIKEGYLGDVVMFNNDLMTIPHEQIMDAKIDFTIVGGKVVYERTEIQ